MASFKNSGSAVDAILGFSASEFLGEVSDAVDAQLVANLEGFQRELQAAANSKGYSSKGVTSAKLEEQCQRLLERMRRHFSKNMGKFELYASRNIFVLPTASSSSSSSSAGAGAGAGDSGTESSSLEHVTAEVEQLRAKYAELQSNYTALSTESRDGDMLVKDMRAALYAIRVGYQSFDEQQLPEIIASMNRDKQKLDELCHRATELTDEIDSASKGGLIVPSDLVEDGSSGSSSSGGGSGGNGASGEVKTSGAADMEGLSASIRGGK